MQDKILASLAEECIRYRWVLRRAQRKGVVEMAKLMIGKCCRIWFEELPGNRLRMIDNSIKYLKLDTQSQLSPITNQYIPTNNKAAVKSLMRVANITGLRDRWETPEPYDLNRVYKGGKTDDERSEAKDNVYSAGIKGLEDDDLPPKRRRKK